MSNKNISKDDFQWIRNPEQKGERLFTFGDGKVYSLFKDYPYNLSKEEKEIFDEINPFWVDFFKDRNQ